MKRFLKEISLFSALILVLYFLFYFLFLQFTLPRRNNAVYIWGDSQMYQDLDLASLNKNTRYHFYSSALHGAGLYDFFVFCESVPENANVLVEISQHTIVRRKDMDRNYSALNLHALYTLFKNNYSFNELSKIVNNNVVPHTLFIDKNEVYAAKDTLTLTEPISLFEAAYATRPPCVQDKINIYVSCLQLLNYKHCHIAGIVFPSHPILNKIEQGSSFYPELLSFQAQMSRFFMQKDTVIIPSNKNIFEDLTHLNARGANYLSTEVAAKLNFSNPATLIYATY